MVVGISVCELHLPAARSLKEKRRVVKSLVERIHHRYRVSVAETDFQNLHQRAEISIAAVANGEGELTRLMQQLRALIDEEMEAVVTLWEPQFLEGGR
jgi:uncharacterized protein YlxP (DUF503 family)